MATTSGLAAADSSQRAFSSDQWRASWGCIPAVAETPGVVVSELRGGDARLAGDKIHVSGVDANLPKVVNLTWQSGSGNVAAQLGKYGAFVTDRYAADNSLQLGSAVTVKTPTGKTLSLHVEGILDAPKVGSPFVEVSI